MKQYFIWWLSTFKWQNHWKQGLEGFTFAFPILSIERLTCW